MKTRIVLFGVILLGCGVCAQATVITSDIDAGWSITNGNPHGVWTYGKYTAWLNPSSFVTYDTPGTNTGIAAGLQHWTYGSASDPCATFNPTSSTLTDLDGGNHAWGNIAWAPGKLAVSPANGPSVVRWTAPTAGSVEWSTVFTGIQVSNDNGNMYVLHNSTVLGESDAAGTDILARSLSGNGLSVAAGDTIDIMVTGDKMTQVDAVFTLTTVPEPGTLVLLALGLASVLAYARWRR